MLISKTKQNRGRKARVGALCFDEGRMMVFVGYYAFPDGSHGKILVTLDEARELSARIGGEKSSARTKLIKWLVKRYGV